MKSITAMLVLGLGFTTIWLSFHLRAQAYQFGTANVSLDDDRFRLLRILAPPPNVDWGTTYLQIYLIGAIGLALLLGGSVGLSIPNRSVDRRFSTLELFAFVAAVSAATPGHVKLHRDLSRKTTLISGTFDKRN